MVNKKILFLTLLVIVLASPTMAFASSACTTIRSFTTITEELGAAIVIIGWIITGILYLTAAGAPDKLGTAKKALIACIIGTVVIIISTGAFAFVSDALKLTGTQFNNCTQ